jgi:hypothetical protein
MVVATLALGSRPRQWFIRLRAKRKPESEGKCEGTIAKVKTQWIEEFFISLESYWNNNV